MSITLAELQPKPFTINLDGLELTCKPPRLSHTLVLAKIGNVFENIDKSNKQAITQAEQDLDEVLAELIPELKGNQLSIKHLISVISQIMQNVQPEDNRELKEKGVTFDTDPKV